MNVLWDISLSFIVGSMLILAVVQSNAELTDMYYTHIMHLSTQERAVIVKEILEQDLKRMGLGILDTTTSLVISDSVLLKFNGDIDLDGIVETVTWMTDNDTSSAITANPEDVVLFRKIDSAAPEKYNIGMLNLNFSFFTDLGNETAARDSVRQVGYSFYMESAEGYMDVFPGTYIEGRVRPMNLK